MYREKRDREGIKDKVARAFLAQSVERAAFNRKVVGSRPTGGVFFERGKGGRGSRREEEKRQGSERVHSSVVERRTAVPAVIGSNPIVPSFWRRYNKNNDNINEEKRRIEES